MELAAENLLAQGFELLEEESAVNSLKIEELFLSGDLKSPNFYVQQLLSDVKNLYNQISSDAIFYNNDKGANLLLCNFNSGAARKYLIHFSGLEENRVYWYKKVTAREIPDLLKEEIRPPADSNASSNDK